MVPRLPVLLSVLVAFVVGSGSFATELKPSFEDYAFHPVPETPLDAAAAAKALRELPVPRADGNYPDENLPFTWDQYAVVRQGTTSDRTYRGFDPGFQPVLIEIVPSIPTNLTVTAFDPILSVQSVTIKAKTGGQKEIFQFRAIARDIRSELASFTYDIRDDASRIRGTPVLARSFGDVVKPGQTVQYSWIKTSQTERFPKCEAQLYGRTGPAKGLTSSVITQVLSTRVRPVVLGHYLMLVTPREVRGEPPRGSISNGQVVLCAQGTANLPPVSDGFLSDNFYPAVNQTITLQPNATDPETGATTFNNQMYEFGDGAVASGVNGSITHAYAQPGIYRVRCVVPDALGLAADTPAEDSVVVGGTQVTKISLTLSKQITPEEAGSGTISDDSIKVTFTDPSGTKTKPGDRIVFLFNRNQFGKANASDNGDITDIILKNGNTFTGKTQRAKNITVTGGKSITISIGSAQLDRTGDPRLGRCELKGIFTNQRVACAVIPADGSTPRVLVYKGNIQIKVKGGQSGRGFFLPEEKITGTATTMDPDPKKQEVY